MRKGVTTLLTVAIALVSVQVQAYAPVIGPIPSPIVGNRVALPSQATRYEFEDAIDLNTLATDDNTAVDQLIWSYEIVGTPKYAVNGDQTINSGAENTVSPATAKRINTTFNSLASANSTDRDGLRNTITIRNIALYPYGGTPSTDSSAAAQNWANNMQAVTFWCSDGNLASSSTVMFYTDNTYNGTTAAGFNRLSAIAGTAWTKMNEWNGAASWGMYDQFLDRCTSTTWGGRGVCFVVGTTGQNWGSVASPMGFVTLTNNSVYKIRALMNCNQLTGGKTPFWDFILENWNGYEPARGLNLYGVDNYYLDNERSANAIINKTAGTEVNMIWAPAAFQTAQWQSTSTGIFAQNALPPAGNGIDYRLQKDAQLRFRVLDVDNNAALFNNQKSGSICLLSCVVETTPTNRKVYTSGSGATPATADIYAVTSGLKAVHNSTTDLVPGNMLVTSITGATISFSGGVLQITPTGTARQNDIVEITPATDTQYVFGGDFSTIDDNWPIAWQSNKIYELEVKMSAPDATAANHPWDIVWFNIEPPTNEVITESYVTANKNIAMPKSGTPQNYYMYYHSCNETASVTPALHFLRWRVRFGNSTGLNWPTNTDVMNTGMVRVHSVKVNTVDFR